MKKILTLISVFSIGMLYLTSCYNNKYDIVSLPQVSFLKDVVPIMTSGPCGCHNSLGRAKANWVQFSDTITGKPKYDLIYTYGNIMNKWAKDSIVHPGGGTVLLSQRDKQVILDWAKQGYPTDYNTTPVSGTVTYTANIVPMLQNTCNSCHTRSAITLTYAILTANSSNLTKMANTNGTAGHPGGPIPLSPTTSKLILDWITQGTKQ